MFPFKREVKKEEQNGGGNEKGSGRRARKSANFQSSSIFSAAMNASCGISTLPNCLIRFLPDFCFSSSFFLRGASPP